MSIEGADFIMRNWSGPVSGRSLKIGSDEHKTLFCRMLLETHNPYKPAVIEWPALTPDARQRVMSLPIWDIAVQTEGRASIRVKTFAALVADPLLRSALDMDAGEEARHKVVLSKLVQAYGIQLEPEPDYAIPRDPAEQIGVAIDPPTLIELCLAENDRRMAGYDGRLLRPAAVPMLARFALRLFRAPIVQNFAVKARNN